MATVRAFLMLLLFQIAGTMVQRLCHSLIPGPVIGMMLLALWLILHTSQPYHGLHRTSDRLLGWLGLFFVPIGAGVLTNFALLRGAWVPVSIGLVGSTFLTLGCTALVYQKLQGRFGKRSPK